MELNLNDITDIADWANKREDIDAVSFQAIDQPFFTKPDKDWFTKTEYSFLWPDDIEKVDNVIDALIFRKEKGGSKIANSVAQLKGFKRYFREPHRIIQHNGCHLGYNSLSVDAVGDMYICFDQEPIGNIVRDSVSSVWESESANETRRAIKKCKKNCKSMMNCFSEDGFIVD